MGFYFSLILMTKARLARVLQVRRVCCTRGRNQAEKSVHTENVSQLQYRSVVYRVSQYKLYS